MQMILDRLVPRLFNGEFQIFLCWFMGRLTIWINWIGCMKWEGGYMDWNIQNGNSTSYTKCPLLDEGVDIMIIWNVGRGSIGYQNEKWFELLQNKVKR
jgi:hypothetical protein